MTATEAPHSVQCPSCESWFPIAPERVPEEGVAAICSHCMRVFRVERPVEAEAEGDGAGPFEADAGDEDTVRRSDVEEGAAEAVGLEEIPVEETPVDLDDAATDAVDPTPVELSEPAGPVGTMDPAGPDESPELVDRAETLDMAGSAHREDAVEGAVAEDDVELEMEPVQPAPDTFDDDFEIEETTTDIVEEAEEESEEDDATGVAAGTEFDVDAEPTDATELDLDEDPAETALDLDEEPTETAVDLDEGPTDPAIDLDEEPTETSIDVDEELDEAAGGPEPKPMPEVEETGGMEKEKLAERARSEEASPVREQSLSRAAARFGRRDPHDRAKRLARVLVSDMLTYHPARYEEALAEGTLKEHFEDEIRLSWEEYEEQIGTDLAESTDYFIQALNEILARGERLFRGIGRPE